ncbi:hypothetical protein SUNI508_04371 [Seiridium unicorne]|uniref:Uncharacterized protein n=1 Tax=Seiridium unicorne TaxID=138068 RepID=A0ABR2V837_9PEZI
MSVVQALLEHGADIEALEKSEYTSLERVLLQMSESKDEGSTVLEALLHTRTNVNRQSSVDGKTPLHLAACLRLTGAIDLMYKIAALRPDTTIRDHDGNTALEVPEVSGHDDIEEVDREYMTV